MDDSATELQRRPVAKRRKRAPNVSASLSRWVVENVTQARELIRSEARAGYQEAAGRLVAVLEKMPDLWQELHEELLLAVWLGSDAGLQARLAEGAAGSLVKFSIQPQNLSSLFTMIGKALADEGRHCSALRAMHRGLKLAPDKASRDESISSLFGLRSRALALWHFCHAQRRSKKQRLCRSYSRYHKGARRRTCRSSAQLPGHRNWNGVSGSYLP